MPASWLDVCGGDVIVRVCLDATLRVLLLIIAICMRKGAVGRRCTRRQLCGDTGGWRLALGGHACLRGCLCCLPCGCLLLMSRFHNSCATRAPAQHTLGGLEPHTLELRAACALSPRQRGAREHGERRREAPRALRLACRHAGVARRLPDAVRICRTPSRSPEPGPTRFAIQTCRHHGSRRP